MVIKLIADKIRLSGPKIDGSYTITLEVGEYEKNNVARVLAMPEGIYEVKIENKTN